MQGEKFKVRDVDEWKKALIKLAKMKDSDSELAKLNLRNPEDIIGDNEFTDVLLIEKNCHGSRMMRL